MTNQGLELKSTQDDTNTDSNCRQLRNIQYQTLIMNHSSNLTTTNSFTAENQLEIDVLLEQESKINKKQPWIRLSRTEQIEKLHTFAEKYIEDNDLSKDCLQTLQQYLTTCIDQRRFRNAKEIQYNKNDGRIEALPNLVFLSSTRRFTLKKTLGQTSTASLLNLGKDKSKSKGKGSGKEKGTRRKNKKIEK